MGGIMRNYLLKRIVISLFVLIGISLLSFYLGVISPGDPAEIVLNQNGLESPSEEQISKMREELGLNKPWWIQYMDWGVKILHGDLGISYVSSRDIAQEVLLRLPVTIELSLLALTIATIVGISLGVYCAIHEGEFVDNLFKIISDIECHSCYNGSWY